MYSPHYIRATAYATRTLCGFRCVSIGVLGLTPKAIVYHPRLRGFRYEAGLQPAEFTNSSLGIRTSYFLNPSA